MGSQEAITDGIEKGFERHHDAVLLETAAGGADATAHEHREDRGEEQGLSKGHEGREIRVGETGCCRAAHEIEGDVHRGLVDRNRGVLKMVDEQEAPEREGEEDEEGTDPEDGLGIAEELLPLSGKEERVEDEADRGKGHKDHHDDLDA